MEPPHLSCLDFLVLDDFVGLIRKLDRTPNVHPQLRRLFLEALHLPSISSSSMMILIQLTLGAVTVLIRWLREIVMMCGPYFLTLTFRYAIIYNKWSALTFRFTMYYRGLWYEPSARACKLFLNLKNRAFCYTLKTKKFATKPIY